MPFCSPCSGTIGCVCLQHAVDKLIGDVAALAAPGSLFHFDFLHLDVLEGRTAAVGYDNTAEASVGIQSVLASNLCWHPICVGIQSVLASNLGTFLAVNLLLLCTFYSAHYILCLLLCTLCSVHSAMYILLCTFCSVVAVLYFLQ